MTKSNILSRCMTVTSLTRYTLDGYTHIQVYIRRLYPYTFDGYTHIECFFQIASKLIRMTIGFCPVSSKLVRMTTGFCPGYWKSLRRPNSFSSRRDEICLYGTPSPTSLKYQTLLHINFPYRDKTRQSLSHVLTSLLIHFEWVYPILSYAYDICSKRYFRNVRNV